MRLRFHGLCGYRDWSRASISIQDGLLNGVVPPGSLFEPPFTDIDTLVPMAMFPAGQVTTIVEVLNDIRARAA